MTHDFSGKTALITGASRGIGLAIAERLAEQRVTRLCLVARQSQGLEATADQLRHKFGVAVDTLAIDLATGNASDRIASRWPVVDILVNNAADSRPGALTVASEADWRSSIELKIMAYVALARQYYVSMKQHGGGVILNSIGSAGENWDANYVIGTTVNAAMMAFTRAVGGASLEDNIRVVGVNPGPVSTDRLLRLMKHRAAEQFGDEQRWSEYTRDLPGGRPATPREVANLFAWLASDEASYISGTIVTIDGGGSSRRRTL